MRTTRVDGINGVATDVEVAWLAGLIDGEGHVSVHANGERWYQASIGIRHTDPYTITECSRVLRELNISHGTLWEERGEHRPSCWLNVTGMETVQHLAEALMPYTITKRRQLMLISEWCSRRLDAKPKSGYSPDELAIAQRFKTLNVEREAVQAQ